MWNGRSIVGRHQGTYTYNTVLEIIGNRARSTLGITYSIEYNQDDITVLLDEVIYSLYNSACMGFGDWESTSTTGVLVDR